MPPWPLPFHGKVLRVESRALRHWLVRGATPTTDRRIRVIFNWLTSTYYGTVHQLLIPSHGRVYKGNVR